MLCFPPQIFGAPSFDDKILEVVAVFGSMQMAVSRVIKLQHHRIAQVCSLSGRQETSWQGGRWRREVVVSEAAKVHLDQVLAVLFSFEVRNK